VLRTARRSFTEHLRRTVADSGGGERYRGIQVLRLVAAALVVVTHSTLYAHERLDRSSPVWQGGVIGVDIFFVISGFVIMASSRRLIGRPDGVREFALRRLVRILPMYWLATTLSIVIQLVTPSAVLHSTLTVWLIVSSYLLLPATSSTGNVEPVLGVGWTLLFEMFFYAVFAVAMLLRGRVYLVVGLVMGFCAVAYFFVHGQGPAVTVYASPGSWSSTAGWSWPIW
jgi:peptidoglycan/LPS O-acetylase OafA/YrhL